jgi:hypothetical protein
MTKLILILIFILCIIPPLVYDYQYASCGDDSYFHMERVDEIEEQGISIPDSRYIGQNATWLWLKPFGGTDYTFMWFNWLAMAGAMLAIYLWGRGLVGKQAGLAMMVCAVMVAPAMLDLFHNGTIYNIINLYIFGLGTSFCLLRWLEKGRLYHFTVSILLLMIISLYHSSSSLVTLASIGLFLVGLMAYSLYRKDYTKLKKLVIYLFSLMAVFALVGHSLNPELNRLTEQVTSGNLTGKLMQNTPEGSPNDNLPMAYWLFKVWSPWLLILMAVSGIILYRAKAKLDGRLLWLMGSFCCVLGVGAFTAFFYDTHRFGLDLAIMASMLAGYLIVKAIQARKKKLYTAAVWVVLILCSLPAVIWLLSYNNAMTPADLSAVRWLNEHEGSWTTSSQVQHLIYERFADSEYSYPDGDYVVWRSEPQTIWCDPDMWWWRYNDHHPNESVMDDYARMDRLAEWEWKGTQVIIYGGSNEEN